MMRLRVSGLPASALVVALVALAGPASAEDVTKDQCIDANAKAQDLRRDHKLALAREQLAICVDPVCPTLVRTDCTKRFMDLEAAQPSVLFDVTDPGGALIANAKVTVDGKALAHIDPATAVSLDPGEHKATFEAVGFQPITRTVVMIEGDKGQHEHVTLKPVAAERPVAAPPPEEGMPTQKLVGIIAGGAGVAGIVLGGVFGGLTLSEKSDQVAVCGGPCSATAHATALSDHSAGITDSTVSTIGFIAGAVLLGGGAYLFFSAKPAATRATSLGLTLAPAFGPGTGGIAAAGRF